MKIIPAHKYFSRVPILSGITIAMLFLFFAYPIGFADSARDLDLDKNSCDETDARDNTFNAETEENSCSESSKHGSSSRDHSSSAEPSNNDNPSKTKEFAKSAVHRAVEFAQGASKAIPVCALQAAAVGKKAPGTAKSKGIVAAWAFASCEVMEGLSNAMDGASDEVKQELKPKEVERVQLRKRHSAGRAPNLNDLPSGVSAIR